MVYTVMSRYGGLKTVVNHYMYQLKKYSDKTY